MASSLVAEDPGELGELTLSATLTQTQTWAFGEFGLKLYTDTDTQHKCSSCSCKFKCNVFIMIKVVCYTYLAATTIFLNVIERKNKRQIFPPDPIILATLSPNQPPTINHNTFSKDQDPDGACTQHLHYYTRNMCTEHTSG